MNKHKITFTTVLLVLAASTPQLAAQTLHHWRFEDGQFLDDAVGGATLVGTMAEQVSLPADGPGSDFPPRFDGGIFNESAVKFLDQSNGLFNTSTTAVTGSFTIELFTNIEDLSHPRTGGDAVFAAQASGNVVDPAGLSWIFRVEMEGGADRALALGLSNGVGWDLPTSKIRIEEQTDYYVAAAFDVQNRLVTYYAKDLTNDTPLVSRHVGHSSTSVRPDSYFQIGNITTLGPSEGHLDGLIDEVRFSKGVVPFDDLLINSTRIVGGWHDTNVDSQWDDFNIAPSGTASQSSDLHSRSTAQNAIDLDSSTMAQTSRKEDQHWWQVDLGQATAVNSIIIENGGSGSRNLTDGGGFVAQVLAEDGTVAFAQSFIDVEVDSLGTLQIDLPQDEPIMGRTVRLSKLDPVKSSAGGIFKLAEVQVMSDVERFEMAAEETWFFEIDAEADTSDVLEISGQLDIKGSRLDLSLLDGDLNAGDTFDLLNSDGISGEFATINLPVLADSLQWNTSSLYVDGSLSVMLRGDFDNSGKIDPQDIDLLSMAEGDPAFDLSGDGLLGVNDVDVLLGLAKRRNGDLDFSGTVDFSDFLVLSDNFGAEGKWTEGDLDLDGQVVFADFLILADNFGQTTAAAVPEPSSLSLFALCLAALSLRRKAVESS